MNETDGRFYLGEEVDAEGTRTGDKVAYDPSHLTTHGVIVGMTGSGKTGLGVVLLEEALLNGIPALIIDPKGDMGNLLLSFPDLAPSKFAEWVDPADAAKKDQTVDAYGAATAETWKNGLADWGIGPDRIAALHEKADFRIFTPGSTAGTGLNLIGSLNAPADGDIEMMRDEIETFTTSLLSLVGIASDPMSSREHILISNLIEKAWSEGQSLDLATLLMSIQNPPMRKLGVLELDTFFPEKDRGALAMRLNGLLASPSFAAWSAGEPLDYDAIFKPANGKAGAAIVSLAHLSDEERQFTVALVLSRLITWMRRQPGTSNLRAMVYMDEVFGFVPPSANPPAKNPILTILKQARAFGVGMVLSTQNPVDIDYKAISNAGTWMIGRLQTERDKQRLLDGMDSAAGGGDKSKLADQIASLDKRQFVLHQTRSDTPTAFQTRWAMSYLRGPLTRDEIAKVNPPLPGGSATPAAPASAPAAPAQGAAPAAAVAAAPAPAAAPALREDESATAPAVADGIPVRYLDPAAPWASEVGATPGGGRLVPAIAARVKLLFDDDKAGLRHEEEYETVFYPAGEHIDVAAGKAVDYDDRDLRTEAPSPAVYVLNEAPLKNKTYWSGLEKDLKDHLYREQTVEIRKNTALKLFSRIGETSEEFAARCEVAADDAADAAAAKIRDRIEKKIDRVRVAIAKAEDRVGEIEADSKSRKTQEVISAAGGLLSTFLGGKKSARSIATEVRRASSRRASTSKAGGRLGTAQNRVAEKIDELETLEDELADALVEIADEWDDKAAEVETVEVGLEKTDIAVTQVALVWVPTP